MNNTPHRIIISGGDMAMSGSSLSHKSTDLEEIRKKVLTMSNESYRGYSNYGISKGYEAACLDLIDYIDELLLRSGR